MEFDRIKEFIKDVGRSGFHYELARHKFFRSKSEMRRWKDSLALRRKKKKERNVRVGIQRAIQREREKQSAVGL